MSETTAPVRIGSHKDVIGPGIVFVPNAPRSSTTIIWGNSLRISRGMRAENPDCCFSALFARNAATRLNP